MGALKQGALADTFRRFPSIASVIMTVMPGKINKIIADTKTNERFAIKMIDEWVQRSLHSHSLQSADLSIRRLKRRTDRKDFMTKILEERDPQLVSDIQLAAHASDFVLAGSETTATALCTITYYLCRNPQIMAKLQEEITGSFKHYTDINGASTASLKYLHAVALEGLRLYPPLPFALPRIVPAGGDIVDGHFLPAGVGLSLPSEYFFPNANHEKTIVSTNPLAACLSPANFKDPWAFVPERWTSADTNDQLDASQPFSLGSRGCLGRK